MTDLTLQERVLRIVVVLPGFREDIVRLWLCAMMAAAPLGGLAMGHATVAGARMPQTQESPPVDDYAEGYRWAGIIAVPKPEQCPAGSWSFARGCRAFIQARDGA